MRNLNLKKGAKLHNKYENKSNPNSDLKATVLLNSSPHLYPSTLKKYIHKIKKMIVNNNQTKSSLLCL